MSGDQFQRGFEYGLRIGLLAARSIVIESRYSPVGKIDACIAQITDALQERWEGRPRQMVRGDLYLLRPMMMAADLGIPTPSTGEG